jgi:hypothetical protein
MLIVGIDPDLSGGLYFLDPAEPSTGEAFDMPVHLLARGGRGKCEINAYELIRLLERPLDHAFVEQAGAMPRQVWRWSAGSGSVALLTPSIARMFAASRLVDEI